MFVIFDLDGTLADCEHRKFLINPPPEEDTHPQWDEFYRRCVDDKPIMPIVNLLISMNLACHRIEIWTGRSDLVRSETEAWLRTHCIPPHLLTRMRPHGDHSNDAELKRSWLREHTMTPESWRPNIVFEDRSRVVEMWRDEGIQCCQVAPGDF